MNRSRQTESLIILGRGRVGRSIHRAAVAKGIPSSVRPGTDTLSAEAAAGVTVILAVPGPVIAEVCDRQISAGSRPRTIAHVDGFLGLRELASAAEVDVETLALHPLQTFPSADTALTGVPCAVTASGEPATHRGFELVRLLGMEPFALEDDARALYHAAASMSSNLLVALEESATAMLRAAGVQSAREALAPLIAQTATNWSRMGAEALTGPIARGEEETIVGHRAAIAERVPELLPTYDSLAARAHAVATGASQT